ncbi:Putative ribonuclease H protein At1g65750 [Linum perenne]
MQMSMLPVTNCDKIDRKICNSVWGTKEDTRKICLVAWEKVCLSKEAGGLGLRLARQLNRAYITKLAFTFIKEKDKLWIKVMENKYFKHAENGLVRRNLKSSSPVWRGISQEWHTMLSGAKPVIRDGNNTLFWTDNWIDCDLKLSDLADPNDQNIHLSSTVAEMVTTEGAWDFNRLACFLPSEAMDLVAGMTPPQAGRGEDDWVWGRDRSGIFSIKLAYNLICQVDAYPISNICKAVWKWSGPNRIRLFLWLAAKDILLTNEARVQRGLTQNKRCCRCDVNDESITRVLRDCEFAAETWKATGDFDTRDSSW